MSGKYDFIRDTVKPYPTYRIRPFTEVEWRRNLHAIKYTLDLENLKDSEEYLRRLVAFIDKVTERLIEEGMARGKYSSREAAREAQHPFSTTFRTYMNGSLQYLERGFPKVRENADYDDIDSAMTHISQRGRWDMDERGWMTEEELEERKNLNKGLKYMARDFVDTMGRGWSHREWFDEGFSMQIDETTWTHFIFPDDMLPIPHSGMELPTGAACPHMGEWRARGTNVLKLIHEEQAMPQLNEQDVVWKLDTPWSRKTSKRSAYPLGHRVHVIPIEEDIGALDPWPPGKTPPKCPVSGIWRAINNEGEAEDDVSMQFYNINQEMFAYQKHVPINAEEENRVITEGDWELVYVV